MNGEYYYLSNLLSTHSRYFVVNMTDNGKTGENTGMKIEFECGTV